MTEASICIGFTLALALVLVLPVACTVRSVTVCATYDRALARPDPVAQVSRDSAGASVCAEAGPREPRE
jgi:hypothetical protein